MILVRSDGVQYPPLAFSAFSQVIAFMQCLETQLAPKGSLNPPTDDVDWDDSCQLMLFFCLPPVLGLFGTLISFSE